MPLYEYECPKDGTSEQIQKISDPPLAKCPKCGGPVERLLSAPAIQFKGTGWYVTDYAKKGDAGSGKKDGKDAGASESSSRSAARSAGWSSSRAGMPPSPTRTGSTR